MLLSILVFVYLKYNLPDITMLNKLSAAIETVIKQKIDINQLKDSKELIAELGLNSINRMRLILELEKAFEIEFDLENLDISVFNSIEGLENYIKYNLEKV